MKVLFSLLIVFSTTLGFSQITCDTATIYATTSSNAVCFDTTFSKVLNCYSNNYPDHTDSYNSPFTLAATEELYSMCLYPDTAATFTPLYEVTETTVGCTDTYTFGVGTNGVKYDPSSAEYFEHTGTGANNLDWHVEARYLFAANFGNNGGHLNPFGEYHYHDVPADYFAIDLGIDGSSHSPIIGYAADGFPMYYKYTYTDAMDSGSGITGFESGYTLKTGTRPGDGVSAPDGAYTGLYYEDYEFAAGNLDECNGRYGITPEFPGGTYYYVLTDSYPYIPRCFKGTVVDNTFLVGPGAACPSSTADTDCSASAAISGCTDPFSCNYNALATIDDGSCYYDYEYETLTITSCPDYTTPSGAIYTMTGTYQDTVVLSGCDSVYTINLTIGGGPTSARSSNNPTACGATDGSISFGMPSGTSPFSFSIDGGATYSTTIPPNFTGLNAGTYVTIIQDGNGCQQEINVTLTDPGAPVITGLTITEGCGIDGQIDVTATGTATLMYSIDGGVTYGTTSTFTGLTDGGYTVMIQDGAGCIADSIITVSNFTIPTINSVSAVTTTCNGDADGSLTITATAGSDPTLQYSSDGITYQTSSVLSGLGAGAYTVFVMDANACQVSTSATVAEPAVLTLDSQTTTDVTCNGAADGTITLAASGGTGAIIYSIDNGITFLPSSAFTGLAAGSYDVVLQDANGCLTNSTTSISEPAELVIDSETVTDANCGSADGEIIIAASGGTAPLIYSIDNGITFQASGSFSALAGGTYNCVVEDANGCQTITSINVNAVGGVEIDNVILTNPLCFGDANGEIGIVISSGTAPYTFSIDNGTTSQTAGTFSGLTAGTYDIVVVDNDGCEATQTVTLSQSADLGVTGSITSETSAANGAIDITVTGGTSPFTFDWDNDGNGDNDDTEDLSSLVGGVYEVIITDANGCTITTSFTVDSELKVSHNAFDLELFPNPSSGLVNVKIPNGTLFEYQVYDLTGKLVQEGYSKNLIDLTDVENGIYTVLITQNSKSYLSKIVKSK